MSISSNLMSSGAEDVDIQYAEAEGSKGGVGRRGGVTTQKPICGYYKKDRCQLGQMCRFAHSLQEHSNPHLISARRRVARASRKKRGSSSSSTASIASSCDVASTLDDYTIYTDEVVGIDGYGRVEPPMGAYGESSQAMSMTCPGYYTVDCCYAAPTCSGVARGDDIPSFSMSYGVYIGRRKPEVESCPVRPLPVGCANCTRNLPFFPYAATAEELRACAPDHYED